MMLTSSFVFLKGIGTVTERHFWTEGITDWERFLHRPSIRGLSHERKVLYDEELRAACLAFNARNPRFFSTRFKTRDHWRLFEVFGEGALYLDIETTGMSAPDGDVTLVGLYAHGRMTSLVLGETLTEERLEAELSQADLLVTFFGTVFDIPYLRAKFPRLKWSLPHFDLCLAARRLGLQGGLKRIEHQLGLERDPDLQGLDGWDAVRLWSRWQRGDENARDRLLRYNAADTMNLEPLAIHLFGELRQRYGPPLESLYAMSSPSVLA
jgi:hypothetical protein